ncbi:Putative ATPase [Umbelopsis nana]
MSSILTLSDQSKSSSSVSMEPELSETTESSSKSSNASPSQSAPVEIEDENDQDESIITEAMKKEEEELAKATEEEEQSALAKAKQEFDANVRDNRLKSLHFLLEQSSAYATILGQRMEKQKEEAREKALKATPKPENEVQPPKTDNEGTSRTMRSGEKVVAATPAAKSRKSAATDAKKRKAKDSDYNLEDYIGSDDLKRRKVGENDIDDAIREDQAAAKAADEQRTKPSPSARQPSLVTGGILRDYQLAGVEWLITLWENGLNGILADEMGLGKTLQTISFIAHLKAMNVAGPYLICTPLSTLANWVQEFHRFTPDINVLLYHGTKEERLHMMNRKLQPKKQLQPDFPIIVTSYEIVMNDRKFLQRYSWKYIVVDEGHRIKNLNCRLIHELKSFKSANRLLLTGTPLQNSLAELWSLLNFLLPEIFNDLDTFQSWFDFSDMSKQSGRERIMKEEEEDKVVTKLHMILRPFLLRRLKVDVEKSLPKKKEYLLYAPLTKPQKELYDAIIRRDLRKHLVAQMTNTKAKEDESEMLDETNGPRRSKRGTLPTAYKEVGDREFFSGKENKQEEKPVDNEALGKKHELSTVLKQVNGLHLQNIVMQLRKVCNHPFLFDWPIDRATNQPILNDELAAQSGKVLLLDRLLTALFQRDHKVLVFSQMTKMLDILEDWATELKGWPICRLDGSVSQEERRQQIAHFNDPESNVRLFLLSTRAGGLGINLTAADTVVIFDSDWNPQMDLQAQDRVHRIGQTKPVLIYRFVAANTVEAKILERATAKRRLEKLVIHSSKFRAPVSSLTPSEKKERETSMRELADILASEDGEQVQIVAQGDKVISDEDLEKLLDRSESVFNAENATPSGQFREIDTSELRDTKNEILATRV